MLHAGANQSFQKFQSLFVRREPQNSLTYQVVRNGPTRSLLNKQPYYQKNRKQYQRTFSRSDGTYKPSHTGTTRETFPTTLDPPPEISGQRIPKRGTLKNGADPSSFCQNAKVSGIHLVKKTNGQITVTPEGGCKKYGRIIRLADQLQEGTCWQAKY